MHLSNSIMLLKSNLQHINLVLKERQNSNIVIQKTILQSSNNQHTNNFYFAVLSTNIKSYCFITPIRYKSNLLHISAMRM